MVEVNSRFLADSLRRQIEFKIHGQQWEFARYCFEKHGIGQSEAREL